MTAAPRAYVSPTGKSASPGSERVVPSVLWLASGLALFLFGMHSLTVGLRRGAGPRARRALSAMTGSRWRAFCTGAAVTGLIQSSSATNVLVVGFVQAGLLPLSQAVAVMVGANVGTTVTSQLLAFDVWQWAPLSIALGLGLHGWARGAPRSVCRRRLVFGGGVFIGFGALLLGMESMRLALAPLARLPAVDAWLPRLAERPLAAVAAGALFTGVVQSSSMTTGMTMVMADAGLVDLQGAVGIVLGANVGTVATTLLAGAGRGAAARRAAVADLVFNVVGVLLFFPFLSPFTAFVARTAADGARQVAHAQLLFNLVTALAVLPFVPGLAALATKLVSDGRRQD